MKIHETFCLSYDRWDDPGGHDGPRVPSYSYCGGIDGELTVEREPGELFPSLEKLVEIAEGWCVYADTVLTWEIASMTDDAIVVRVGRANRDALEWEASAAAEEAEAEAEDAAYEWARDRELEKY